MTTVEDASPNAANAPHGIKRLLPEWSKLRSALYETIAVGSVTLVAGAVLSAVLEEPVKTRLIPLILEHTSQYERVEIYKQAADGKPVVASCYKLLVAPWSNSVLGRMVEITDPKLCASVPDPEDDPAPVQFRTDGAWNGNVMSVAFSHFNGEFGGGSFSADAMNTPGTYIGAMQAQAHDGSQRCVLTHFWVVVGKPERQSSFQKMLEERIKDPDGQIASLAKPLTGGQCKADQRTANASDGTKAN
ncbi:hypothetical protein ACNJYD_10045 [Bradyrhizobium sp. DASA03005]|uniref:hypothetical protein n=1 Tax=Bradyrhizobium sp. SPXBL-02 TaxID=3395912 RepID=UPI003F71875A